MLKDVSFIKIVNVILDYVEKSLLRKWSPCNLTLYFVGKTIDCDIELLHAVIGTKAEFKCAVSGTPPVMISDVKWTKYSSTVSETSIKNNDK